MYPQRIWPPHLQRRIDRPEYASRFIDMVLDRGIEYKLNTMVMDISADKK